MANSNALESILTADEAAEFLHCSARTVHRLCDRGALRFCRVGNRYRITRESLLRYAGCESDAAKAE